jgi:hypothetical protein
MKESISSKVTALIGRRSLFAGVGVAGAAAAVATLAPAIKPSEQSLAKAASPEATGGYQLTDHVKRYYETTRI